MKTLFFVQNNQTKEYSFVSSLNLNDSNYTLFSAYQFPLNIKLEPSLDSTKAIYLARKFGKKILQMYYK